MSEERVYWKVEYVSCEGNNRWYSVSTPANWSKQDVIDNIPIGGCGDDVAEIVDVTETNESWDAYPIDRDIK